MVALLPFWPSVYNKLATDCDGRVREQAHVALHAVVRSVGRELATCLRSVCSVWWLARWDPHAPAAAAASAAWSTAPKRRQSTGSSVRSSSVRPSSPPCGAQCGWGGGAPRAPGALGDPRVHGAPGARSCIVYNNV